VLFLDNGRHTLGKIFDVIGPVSVPIYCVRFNTHDDIVTKGITVGNKVFCAPRTEHSQFVILSNIMTKGSDASWKNDIEPPDNMIDHSDDEQERRTKKKSRANRTQSTQNPNGERREFIRARHHMMNQPQQQYQPNLAYPNYSWHQNFPPPMPNYGQQQQNFPNYSHQPFYPQQ
jgi:H/ACA ribonucleoprotein complex non-core subunit NAF1